MSDDDVTETHYSHHDPAVAQDPYAVFAGIREKCPLGHSDQLGGFYFPTTYDGVKRVFSDFRNFTSTEGSGLPLLRQLSREAFIASRAARQRSRS